MQIYKEGIVRTIRDTEWQKYREMGFIEITANKPEPQPEQETEQDEKDDFVVTKAKPKNAKRGK